MANNLPQNCWGLQDIFFQSRKLFSQDCQVLKSMLRVFMQKLYYDLAHVVTYYKVFEKIRDLVHIRIRRRIMQFVVINKLGNFLSRSSANQKFKNNCSNAINVAQFCNFLRLFVPFNQKIFLNFVSFIVNFAIFLRNNLS